ncbi:response regulator [Minwuia thermotolerans]|uniref:Response regulator n=1 Tax=Minwuia thermotolerans TaxID=2056226 RepID=A0A2M9FXJ3_9PROT|nr:response regulator [Minwuia thermotolerans]PJK28174.1 response regulator [Minwuia thermotolerans]
MNNENRLVARNLPYLRRYARALTGSQTRGDRYVVLCLEAMLCDAEAGTPPPASRVELYRRFHNAWERTGPIHAEPGSGGEPAGRGADAYLQALAEHKRQALLLTAIDGFSTEETARILDRPEEDVGRLLQLAYDDLQNQTATTALVIEDEPIIAVDIVGIVEEMGHRVVGTAATRDEAVAIARRTNPGIVMADIELGDGSSGIDAVEDILDALDVPVIFVTAYPERLLSGQGREPAFLVTKPFEPETLRVTIYHALMAAPAGRQAA